MSDTDTLRRTDLLNLLDRLADGDHTAFATLHLNLRKQIYQAAQALLTDHAAAQLVTDGVFVELWHRSRVRTARRPDVLEWALDITRRRSLSRRPSDDHLHCHLTMLLAAGGAVPPVPCQCVNE
jgi:DNA-directed RNA polymerase specialized sigma24 family protein